MDIYLHEVYPRLAMAWDGKPVVYMSYKGDIGEGTQSLGPMDADPARLTRGIAELVGKLDPGTKIQFHNGDPTLVYIGTGQNIPPHLTSRLDPGMYRTLLTELRSMDIPGAADALKEIFS